MDVVDHVLCQELAKLVEELATSGKPTLEESTIKKIKKICRTSNGYVEYVYHQLDTWLEKDHSEIRLSALQMYDQLFQRSHHFRTLLLADFQNFTELTLGIDQNFPLPPPKPAAEKLKALAIDVVRQWQEKFGEDYKPLSLGYNYLKTCKKVDFENRQTQTQAQRRRNEERQQRIQSIQEQRVTTTITEMTEMKYEVDNLLCQADTCLRLILPDPDQFDIMSPRREDQFGPFSPGKMMSPRRRSSPRRQSKRRSMSTSESANQDNNDEGTLDDKSCDSKEKVKAECLDSETSTSSAAKTADAPSTPDTIKVEVKTESETSSLNDNGQPESNQNCSVKQENLDPESKRSDVKKEQDQADKKESDEEFYEITSSEEEEEEEEEEEIDYDDLEDAYYGQQSQFVREHGLGTQVYNLNIEILPNELTVEQNEDNKDILRNLADILQLINIKLLPTVNRWLEVFTKNGGSQDNIKSAMDTRDALQKAKEKIEKLNIRLDVVNIGDNDGDEDDDDFEDVPDASQKEGYEAHVPQHLQAEYGLEEESLPKQPRPGTSRDWTPYQPEIEHPSDPTSSASTINKLRNQLGNSALSTSSPKPKPVTKTQNKDKGETEVPVLPYGADLRHWGSKDVEPPLLVRYDSEHRFWIPKGNEDLVDVNALEARQSRIINFTGKFVPVKWKCRAPLPNGRLCERMDRIKCPFHGKIIGRDNMGRPSNPEDAARLQQEEEKRQQEKPAWEDEDLHAEIEAATGKDLRRKGKGKGKGKKKKYPNLTDLKKKKNTSRNRLEAKVLSRKAIKRVSNAMNTLEAKRYKDKFGNQFNYAFKPR